MARRSDHSREELRALIMSCARKIAEKEGLRGLTARRIAADIGYAPGTIYNLFSNLDDLILHIRGDTLDEFYEFLSKEKPTGDPEADLMNIARNYIEFVHKHSKLWELMFEHKLPDEYNPPDWYHEKALKLFTLAENTIAVFFSPGQEEERFHHAQVVWASLHGICSIPAHKLVVKESTELMAQSLITRYVAGLRYESNTNASNTRT